MTRVSNCSLLCVGSNLKPEREEEEEEKDREEGENNQTVASNNLCCVFLLPDSLELLLCGCDVMRLVRTLVIVSLCSAAAATELVCKGEASA